MLTFKRRITRAISTVAFAATAILLIDAAIAADKPAAESGSTITMENLLDRIQVEDLIARYYYDLSTGKAHELSNYFTADAILDVDGMVAKGHEEINKLYAPDPNAKPAPKPTGYRKGNMLLTNPIIEMKGNTATAHVIWTGVMNEGPGKAPTLYEQGREDTDLIKVNGKWMINRRCITSDSGLPDKFDATWYARDRCTYDGKKK